MSEKEKTSEDLTSLIEAGNKTEKRVPKRKRRNERLNVPAKRLKKAHRTVGKHLSLKEFARQEVKESGYHREEAELWLLQKSTKQTKVKKPTIKRIKSSI